jgi:hypothetical protein
MWRHGSAPSPGTPRRVWAATIALCAAGCSDALVDGNFAGDASVHLSGVVAVAIEAPERVQVGALWLGYSAAHVPANGIEPVVLPVSSVRFPPSFSYDLLEAPPSVGQYATADGRLVPALVRFARFVLFDDVDADGTLRVDQKGALQPPDRLLARASKHLLLFVRRGPPDAAALDAADALLENWDDASLGYHLVELEPSVPAPNFSGRIVPTITPVLFTAAEDGTIF